MRHDLPQVTEGAERRASPIRDLLHVAGAHPFHSPVDLEVFLQGDVLPQGKACEDAGRRGLPASHEGRPHENPADTFILDFRPPALEKKIWLFQPLSLGYFFMAALAHQSSLHGQHHSTLLTISPSSQISSLPIFCSECECSDTSMIRLGSLR